MDLDFIDSKFVTLPSRLQAFPARLLVSDNFSPPLPSFISLYKLANFFKKETFFWGKKVVTLEVFKIYNYNKIFFFLNHKSFTVNFVGKLGTSREKSVLL